MKYFLFLMGLITGFQINCVRAQNANWISTKDYLERDSITKDSYTLIFINKDTLFKKNGSELKQRMITAFFKVYPQEAKAFNPHALRKVTFMIDPGYDGVAATAYGVVHFNPRYMLQIPADIDVVTHEVMHIVQAYGDNAGPGWLTEGIADYARYKFGVDNAGADWKMPNYQQGQNYTDSYRITARFLVWLENKVRPGIVKDLDGRMRNHAYNDNTWQQLTGKSLDELWNNYTIDPSI